MPKLVFRHYNLFGEQKYLNFKTEFLPRESFNFYLRFMDPAVMNNKNFSYEISSQYKFSYLNYIAKGTSPLGTAWPVDSEFRWNNKEFMYTDLVFSLKYKIPNNGIIISPKFSIKYETDRFKILEDTTGDIIPYKQAIQQYPIDKITPYGFLSLTFPIEKINASIKTEIQVSYEITIDRYIENISKASNTDKRIFDKLNPYVAYYFSFFITPIEANIIPSIKLNYTRNIDYFFNRNESVDWGRTMANYAHDYLDLVFGLEFNKSFTFRNIKHELKVYAEFSQRLVGETSVKKKYEDENNNVNEYINSYFYNSIFNFNINYIMDYKFLKKS